ncbi:unnamed protein product [Sphenostylis stenocarpa]|uniref:Uncharacterized protein n=1 Tax=Sphenostylis stenocarpa TaxID=92480 RepID=A0AA86V712_9FABA|nr:unnamed protein product [Sphenostylis stenocarpa]
MGQILGRDGMVAIVCRPMINNTISGPSHLQSQCEPLRERLDSFSSRSSMGLLNHKKQVCPQPGGVGDHGLLTCPNLFLSSASPILLDFHPPAKRSRGESSLSVGPVKTSPYHLNLPSGCSLFSFPITTLHLRAGFEGEPDKWVNWINYGMSHPPIVVLGDFSSG